MVQGFSSREEYMYLAEQYRTIRNNLFHPEASISDLNYIEVNKFISILMEIIDDKFFWYASKEELKNVLDALSISVNNALTITIISKLYLSKKINLYVVPKRLVF